MKEKEIEVEGRTVQEAIKKGLKDLGLSQSDVKIKVLNEGKSGLFGLMGASPAKVKISLNTPL
jgi:spoIIIJ-associated protein